MGFVDLNFIIFEMKQLFLFVCRIDGVLNGLEVLHWFLGYCFLALFVLCC